MTNLSIENIHKNKTGKVSDKWASYLIFYDNLLEKYRTKNLNLLEIGVQNGGSLETWNSFFSNANILIGCDIDERCSGLQYDDPRVHIVVGDANQPNTVNKISAICNDFDIVIDDGSHQSTDILNSFLIYFNKVKPGGIYIVEDTHTLYQNLYGGGILNEFSAYSFFKKIIDVISFEFWRNELSLDVYFRTFFSHGQVPGFTGGMDRLNRI
jgi:cephalosporin hydroxylase